MAELPRGTVTILFTDIEGSTRLLRELGRERYSDALTLHRRLLRRVFTQFGGCEVEMQGDSFHVVFTRATDAVGAAVEAQRALARAVWPKGHALRVRIGINSGEPIIAEGHYVGLAVHRAARVMAAAHGGQVLVSQVTEQLLRDAGSAPVELRDVGQHRLKDLLEPERLYQLVAEGLQTEFPPLNTLEHLATNLPIQPTPLVGRDRELRELRALLARSAVRLLTLTGAGGSGKTRLALQLAAELAEDAPDGVFFVPLAAVSDQGLVLPAIAQALGVKEQGGESLVATLHAHLGDRRLLLVLDNFEHLETAGPRIAELLASAARLRVLVTSRAPLHLAAEHEYEVPPLGLPELGRGSDPDSIARSHAVQLFVERARAVKPAFALTAENARDIGDICVRLDGLPLAIELAAARIRILPPSSLRSQLDQRLRLLIGGARDAPTRQQTLRAMIDWSHGLLSQPEQRLFARLGVFVGGCSLAAAEAVCNPKRELGIDLLDALSSLVEKNLLRQVDDLEGEPRFTMLECFREYARERFDESNEGARVAGRHAEFVLELAETAEPKLWMREQQSWLKRLEADHDNARAALSWYHQTARFDAELRLAGSLAHFWWVRGYLSEGYDRLSDVLAATATSATIPRAKALRETAILARFRGDYDGARNLAEQALRLSREVGDELGVARSLGELGAYEVAVGNLERASRLHEESVRLCDQLGDKPNLALSLTNLADCALSQGDYARAVVVAQDALALCRELEFLEGAGYAAYNWAHAAFCSGRRDEALAPLREAVEDAITLHDTRLLAYCLGVLAAIAAENGESAEATKLLGMAEALRAATKGAIEPAERDLRARALAVIRDTVEADAFDVAWAEGEAMTLEQAIAAATDATDNRLVALEWSAAHAD